MTLKEDGLAPTGVDCVGKIINLFFIFLSHVLFLPRLWIILLKCLAQREARIHHILSTTLKNGYHIQQWYHRDLLQTFLFTYLVGT